MLTRSKPAAKPVVSAARQNYNARVKYGFYFGEVASPENIDLSETKVADVSDESDTVMIVCKTETITSVKHNIKSKSDDFLKNLKKALSVLPESTFRKKQSYTIYHIQSVYNNTVINSSCRAGPVVYLQGP